MYGETDFLVKHFCRSRKKSFIEDLQNFYGFARYKMPRSGEIVFTCASPSHIKANELEAWVLKKLSDLILADKAGVEAAIDRFVRMATGEKSNSVNSDRIAKELKQINDTVAAIISNIDPANLAMLNDKLTQLRLRKEHLQNEQAITANTSPDRNEKAMRQWAKDMIRGLENAVNGQRDEATRRVMACYIEKIKIWPSTKTGEMVLNPAAYGLYIKPKRSCADAIGATGLEPATS